MNTIITAEPQVLSRRPRTPSENDLLDILRGQGSWIWTTERLDPPDSPADEQRAFRKVYNYPSNRGKPRSATIMMAADDYGVMYVDGVLVAPANKNLRYTRIVAYEVPLPVVEGDNSTSMLLAFRVINTRGAAGLLVGVQVNFDDAAPPDVFYTGSDSSWVGARLFQEHWWHPVFESSKALSTWNAATAFSSSVRSASVSGAVGNEVLVLGQLTASIPNSTDTQEIPPTHLKDITLSTGGFAGIIVATALAAFAIGAVGAFLLTRKKNARRYKAKFERAGAPQTRPGVPIGSSPMYSE